MLDVGIHFHEFNSSFCLRENYWRSPLHFWGEALQRDCVSLDGPWWVCGRPGFHPASGLAGE